jgi:hypothetical protein
MRERFSTLLHGDLILNPQININLSKRYAANRALKNHNLVLCAVTEYVVIGEYQRFVATYCLHLLSVSFIDLANLVTLHALSIKCLTPSKFII